MPVDVHDHQARCLLIMSLHGDMLLSCRRHESMPIRRRREPFALIDGTTPDR